MESTNNYSESFYTLSSNGLILEKWTGEESLVDFTTDPKLSKVNCIERLSFKDNKHIESIILSDSVTHINSVAFRNCTNLVSI